LHHVGAQYEPKEGIVMGYYEALEAVVSRKEAFREIKKHNLQVSDFIEEVGDKEEYTGKEVLDWLGYWYVHDICVNKQ